MKLRVDIGGEAAMLELQLDGDLSTYTLTGAVDASGEASIIEISPGLFSVLIGSRSFTVHVISKDEHREVWVDGRAFTVTTSDPRDRSLGQKQQTSTGPLQVAAQMPGKVVKVLVEQGAEVRVGQGLIVVEAMKMQNEVKSLRDGLVSAIHVAEGAAVAAGEKLMVIE